jgi:4-amino-4-deoxy-L-arabinose transferase-like glycosyltransferase
LNTHRRIFPALLGLILAAQIAVGVGFAASMPLWLDHEADFYNVVRFIVERGRLPIPEDHPAGDAAIRQATQPFLYFLLTAPILALVDDRAPVPPGTQPFLICAGGANLPAVAALTTAAYTFPPSGSALGGYALRIFGVLLGAAAAALTYAAGRVLFPEHPGAALAAAALLAFEPTLLRQSAIISNDILLLTVAAANLYFLARLVRGGVRPGTLIPVLITAALAALTRLPGWAVLALDGAVLLAIIVRALSGGRRAALLALAGLALIIALAVGVAVFNWARYGSFLGRYQALDQVVLGTLRDFRLPLTTLIGIFDQTWNDTMRLIAALRTRFILERLYGWLPALMLGLALIGGVFAAARRTLGRESILWLALAFAVGLVVVRNITVAGDDNTTLYDTSYIFAPLRYYMAGLPALALLSGIGAARLLSLVRLDGRLGALLALPWLIVSGASVIRIALEAPREIVTARVPDGAQPAVLLTEGAGPRVVAYILRERPADGHLDLTLYLQTDAPLTDNFIGRVSAGEGGARAVCEFAPTDGVYPPPRWSPGEIIRADVTLPYCPPYSRDPLPAGAPITLEWLPFTLDRRRIDAGSILSYQLGTTAQALPRYNDCPGNLGIIQGNYQVAKFNAPPETRLGQTYVPSVNWLVFEPQPNAIARIFVFRHDATGLEFMCSQAARQVSTWVRGEVVFFDGCPMQFPPDAPRGAYTVLVGIQNEQFRYLPAVDANGTPTPLIPIGSVTLKKG